jgi:hypothetical protein
MAVVGQGAPEGVAHLEPAKVRLREETNDFPGFSDHRHHPFPGAGEVTGQAVGFIHNSALVCACYFLQLKPVRLPLAKKATPPPDKNFLTIPPDYRKFPAPRPAFSFHGSHAQAPHAASCCCFSPFIPGR